MVEVLDISVTRLLERYSLQLFLWCILGVTCLEITKEIQVKAIFFQKVANSIRHPLLCITPRIKAHSCYLRKRPVI